MMCNYSYNKGGGAYNKGGGAYNKGGGAVSRYTTYQLQVDIVKMESVNYTQHIVPIAYLCHGNQDILVHLPSIFD